MGDLDLVLLRLLKYRPQYNKLSGIALTSGVGDRTKTFIEDFGKYFKLYPTHDKIDIHTFLRHYVNEWHKGWTKDQYVVEAKIITSFVTVDCDEDQEANIIRHVSESDMAKRLANLAQDYDDGDIEDIYDDVTRIVDSYRRSRGIRATNYIDTPISDLLRQEFDDSGIAWRLGVLQRHMRRMRGGDFGIVAGRPDKGKTTFLVSEVTHFANQLPEDRNIVWLNNEGSGDRIVPRLYQAALGAKMSDLRGLDQSGTLTEAYSKVVGRPDRIRVFDIHGYNTGQVVQILEDNNAAVAVFDMIDNIQGFKDAPRTDLGLEYMYQWAREQMVRLDCIGIATSQISNDGDGLLFPTMGMLKDSKTGKQGACDFQIMIGSSNDPNMETVRGISIPKNKLRRPDAVSNPQQQVIINPIIARYEDIPDGV